MENIKDYSCPPDCPRRSKDCHSHCERYDKYREINQERLKKEQQDKLTCSDSLRKNIKTQNRF